jgi:hypothetical protein
MGDERDDAANRCRAGVSSSARIGAATALTLVLVVLLVLGVAHYQIGHLPSPSSHLRPRLGPR